MLQNKQLHLTCPVNYLYCILLTNKSYILKKIMKKMQETTLFSLEDRSSNNKILLLRHNIVLRSSLQDTILSLSKTIKEKISNSKIIKLSIRR